MAVKQLVDLIAAIEQAAKDFGYNYRKKEKGVFRDCVRDKDNTSNIRSLYADEHNFWCGYIREDQGPSGKYEGLSFVVMPEATGDHCLVSIGIGSNDIGPDKELAANPAFRRSFMRLTGGGDKADAHFFFKLRFDEMVTPIEELSAEVLSMTSSGKSKYSAEMQNTVVLYNDDVNKDFPALLPAAMIVNYKTDEGYNLIISWLAQYAYWRNWYCEYGKGTPIPTAETRMNEAIDKCRAPAVCPDIKDIKDILLKQRFVVLQGAPGCGKTWSATQIANDVDFKSTHEFIQFHAETTYADFVYGIKPVLDGKTVAYEGEKGVLLKILDEALKEENKEKKFLLIIDEINRANLASVLGPVFFLFEQKASETRNLKLSLGRCKENNEIVEKEYTHIPENMYVIATMNTADKSLAVVDFALRRRFTWLTLRPHSLDGPDFDKDLFEKVDKLFAEHATDEELNLQPGQSYFLDKSKRKETIKYKLLPLMKEYFAEGFLLSAQEKFATLFYTETNGEATMYE